MTDRSKSTASAFPRLRSAFERDRSRLASAESELEPLLEDQEAGELLDRILAIKSENLKELLQAAGCDSLVGLDLRETDLRNQDLTYLNLSGVDLRGANLSHANLTGATIDPELVEGAVLEGALMPNGWNKEKDQRIASQAISEDSRIAGNDSSEKYAPRISFVTDSERGAAWLIKYHPELSNDQIVRLTRAVKAKVEAIRSPKKRDGIGLLNLRVSKRDGLQDFWGSSSSSIGGLLKRWTTPGASRYSARHSQKADGILTGGTESHRVSAFRDRPMSPVVLKLCTEGQLDAELRIAGVKSRTESSRRRQPIWKKPPK